jgi:molybdopterin/thiamine biosynthesis adenylyltransferase
VAQHRFSNKPQGTKRYPDYYSKMKNYISIISNEAQAIKPDISPCTYRVVVPNDEVSVFNYWDTASSRANIVAVSEKLSTGKIAIIGLGGTGSYLLDLIAKTSVKEIHLYDGDLFEQHNAFRAPGAATIETLEEKLPKVEYFTNVYKAMRKGIYPHHEYLDESNINKLCHFNFVFICVDKGAVRKLISNYLIEQKISFIDVGMGLQLIEEENSLLGTCRVTVATPNKFNHFDKSSPQGTNDKEDIYQTNIQVADMNALNAALAVIKWKQLRGFYQDVAEVYHTTFSLNSHSLTRDESKDS